MKANSLPGNNDPVPESSYTLSVSKLTVKHGEESGTPYFNIDYVISGGQHAGRHVFDCVSLSHKALWMLKDWLVALNLGELELPIEKGADGKLVVDEEACVAIVLDNVSTGMFVKAQIGVVAPNTVKGWPAKNEVVKYSVSETESNWAE